MDQLFEREAPEPEITPEPTETPEPEPVEETPAAPEAEAQPFLTIKEDGKIVPIRTAEDAATQIQQGRYLQRKHQETMARLQRVEWELEQRDRLERERGMAPANRGAQPQEPAFQPDDPYYQEIQRTRQELQQQLAALRAERILGEFQTRHTDLTPELQDEIQRDSARVHQGDWGFILDALVKARRYDELQAGMPAEIQKAEQRALGAQQKAKQQALRAGSPGSVAGKSAPVKKVPDLSAAKSDREELEMMEQIIAMHRAGELPPG
jgi:hypothetical protein